MTTQLVHLPEWDVVCFFDTTMDDADIVLSTIDKIGCSDTLYDMAKDNLTSGEMNTGLTYTSPPSMTTVMVVGRAESKEEYYDTIFHELCHVCDHVANALGIRRNSEEYHYLAGGLARKIYPVVQGYICDCN